MCAPSLFPGIPDRHRGELLRALGTLPIDTDPDIARFQQHLTLPRSRQCQVDLACWCLENDLPDHFTLVVNGSQVSRLDDLRGGVGIAARVLGDCTGLRSLEFSESTVTDEEAQALAGTLSVNLTLRELGFLHCRMSHDACCSLVQALQHNTALECMSFEGVGLDERLGELLARSLCRNHSLKTLVLAHEEASAVHAMLTVLASPCADPATLPADRLALEQLNLGPLHDLDDVDGLWRQLCHILSSRQSTLAGLHLQIKSLKHRHFEQLIAALGCNTAMRSLTFCGSCQPTPEQLVRIGSLLERNKARGSLLSRASLQSTEQVWSEIWKLPLELAKAIVGQTLGGGSPAELWQARGLVLAGREAWKSAREARYAEHIGTATALLSQSLQREYLDGPAQTFTVLDAVEDHLEAMRPLWPTHPDDLGSIDKLIGRHHHAMAWRGKLYQRSQAFWQRLEQFVEGRSACLAIDINQLEDAEHRLRALHNRHLTRQLFLARKDALAHWATWWVHNSGKPRPADAAARGQRLQRRLVGLQPPD